MHSLFDLAMTLSRLPGVGTKSAKRIAYFLLEEPQLAQHLAEQITKLASSVYICPSCGAYTEEMSSCQYCEGYRATPEIVCVVERASDVLAIEASGSFKGLYHVLGGALSPMHGIGPEELRLNQLRDRITSQHITEVIIATNLNLEGDTTAHYLEEWLKDYDVVISRIARGLSVGSHLEFVDKQSLAYSLEGRKKL